MNDHAKRIAQKTQRWDIFWECFHDWTFKIIMAVAAGVIVVDIFGWLR
jgi:hypothetical protein